MVSHPPGHSLLTFCPSPAMAKSQRGDRSFQGAVGFRKCRNDLVAMVGVQGDTVMPSCCLKIMSHGCPVVLLAVVVSCRSN